MPVIEFMLEVLEMPPPWLADRRPLSDAQRVKFTKEIRGEIENMFQIENKQLC